MEKDENKLKGQKKRAKSQTIKAVSGMIASQKQEEIEISLFYVKTPKTHNSRTSPLGSQTHRNSWEHEIQSLPVEAENHTRNSQQSGGEQVRAKN